jgi:hypothetical protein
MMHTEEKTRPLKAEDGADFVATLEATAEGPQAYFTVTCELEEEGRVLMESDQRLFGSEEAAIAWLDEQAMRRGFMRYPMVRE